MHSVTKSRVSKVFGTYNNSARNSKDLSRNSSLGKASPVPCISGFPKIPLGLKAVSGFVLQYPARRPDFGFHVGFMIL